MARILNKSADINGGRVLLLLLLFIISIYGFINSGFTFFSIIISIPILIFLIVIAFKNSMFTFWVLIGVNFILQWKNSPLPLGIPMSLYNEMFEVILIAIAVIDTKNTKFERCGNIMLLTLIVWCGYCTLEVLNDTCNIGLDIGLWYGSARMMAYQLLYAFIVFTLYISNPKIFIRYLFVWGILSLFAVFWVWKQKFIGLNEAENYFLQGRGRSTHLIQGGTLIRYWSI